MISADVGIYFMVILAALYMFSFRFLDADDPLVRYYENQEEEEAANRIPRVRPPTLPDENQNHYLRDRQLNEYRDIYDIQRVQEENNRNREN